MALHNVVKLKAVCVKWYKGAYKMRPSRGMGAILPSKMPTKKIIKRKDKPQDVAVYAQGGAVPKEIK